MALDASFSSLKGLGESFSDAENHLDISLGDDKFSSSWNATGQLNSEKRHTGIDDDRSKRGRPRADIINTLIVQGSKKEDGIRCKICSRVFPREKSLQAHMRTHTGEKPYKCDYPDCGKSFCQSGQLKTHQRLHTGVKPFVCTVPGCESRFTHANRHCSEHPTAGLIREEAPVGYLDLIGEDTKPDIVDWLRKQANAHQKASNSHKQARPTKRCLSQEIETQWIVHKKKKSESECEVDTSKGAIPLMDTSLTGVASATSIAESKEGLHNTSNGSDSLPLCNSFVKEESTAEKVSASQEHDIKSCAYALNSQNSASMTLLQPVPFPMAHSAQIHPSLQHQKDLDKMCGTVTVPTLGLRQSSVIKHTIQVRKDHQLPIQRLLKPEEYEAIMNSPNKKVPQSPVRRSPRRIPFSPIKESTNVNENTPFKSKVQIALFASPEQPKGSTPRRSSSPVQSFYYSPLAVHNLGTPIRSGSPKKFLTGLTHSTPIRSSPRKHINSPAPTKQTPCRNSPSKYHLYTTPSPVAHRINSPRKAHLFVSRMGGTPVKRASPVNLFASPPTKKLYASPIRHFSPQRRCSPRKASFSQKSNSPVDFTIFGKNTPKENPEKLMGALALIKLAGGL